MKVKLFFSLLRQKEVLVGSMYHGDDFFHLVDLVVSIRQFVLFKLHLGKE